MLIKKNFSYLPSNLFIMNKGNKHTSIYLIIAFAIFSVSFVSVINFHIQDNHGMDVLGNLEFLKTELKQSFKDDSSLSFQIDLNSGSLSISENEIIPFNSSYSIDLCISLVSNIYKGCFETPVLRGPPILT